MVLWAQCSANDWLLYNPRATLADPEQLWQFKKHEILMSVNKKTALSCQNGTCKEIKLKCRGVCCDNSGGGGGYLLFFCLRRLFTLLRNPIMQTETHARIGEFSVVPLVVLVKPCSETVPVASYPTTRTAWLDLLLEQWCCMIPPR